MKNFLRIFIAALITVTSVQGYSANYPGYSATYESHLDQAFIQLAMKAGRQSTTDAQKMELIKQVETLIRNSSASDQIRTIDSFLGEISTVKYELTKAKENQTKYILRAAGVLALISTFLWYMASGTNDARIFRKSTMWIAIGTLAAAINKPISIKQIESYIHELHLVLISFRQSIVNQQAAQQLQ